MGVLIEAESVVIRNRTVEQRFPGGIREYERRCPNQSFCTDGRICRVGFMIQADAEEYIDYLCGLGFSRPTAEGSPEVALLDPIGGFAFPCDWLELARVDLGGEEPTTVAWLGGTVLSEVVAPPQWSPGKMRLIDRNERNDLEFLGTKNHMDVFRDKATGELLYAGRTQQVAPPGHIARAKLQARHESLTDESTRLGAFENVPAGEYRGDLVACYQRAKQLVEDTHENEPGPLYLQAVAARLLERWDEAVSLFLRVTELRPDHRDAWLELTCVLVTLRRFEEAERAARKAVEIRPEHAGAFCNLAAVLLEQGRLDEARSMAERALAADPAGAKIKAVVAAVESATSRAKPWWRRLLRTRRDDLDRG